MNICILSEQEKLLQLEHEHEQCTLFMRLNQEGVILLRCHRHFEALTNFRKAIDLLRVAIKDDDDDDNNNNNNDSDDKIYDDEYDDYKTKSPGIHSIPVFAPKGGLDTNCDENGAEADKQAAAVSPHNEFCLYARALLIDSSMMNIKRISLPPSSMLPSKSDMTAPTTIETYYKFPSGQAASDITMAVLFNMGLTCHLYGLFCCPGYGNQTNMYLQRAMGLYQMVASIISGVDDNDEKSYTDASNGCTTSRQSSRTQPSLLVQQQKQKQLITSKLLQLALWSNMGHLYSHFFQHHEASTCRIRLTVAMQECPRNEQIRQLQQDNIDSTNNEHVVVADESLEGNNNNNSNTNNVLESSIDFITILSEEERSILMLNAILMVKCSRSRAAPAA